ncbi:transposon Ty3-I Gag-Pol polyprotein [Trichonephila clavipes]|nr:transposon Ty3-I Gag-Pol polyprotein [Trichonephila clavipes]
MCGERLDNRPVCFHRGRPGHVMRYCRERKAVFDNSRNRRRNFDDVGTPKKKYADQTLPRRFTPSPTRGRSPIRRYRSPSPYRRSSQSPGRRARKTPKESDLPREVRPRVLKSVDRQDDCHDVILGWDFLEASQAVIDCGQNELVLEDICRDSTAPDAWNLVSPTERRIIHEEVQKMLDEGIVQPSESPWSSPIVLRWKHFNSLKKALTSGSSIGDVRDERASTEIHTDASGYGIGAVLVQIQNNVEKVIAYASRTLTKAEKNYSTTERECLAIVWATNKFRPYIFGKHFTVVIRPSFLCWLMNLKDPSGSFLPDGPSGLQEHDFDVNINRKNFDPDGKLWLPVIPKHLRADILRHFHDAPTAGHLGFAKTYDRIRKRFYWPGMYRNVVRYVMHCRECQRRKSVPQRPPDV